MDLGIDGNGAVNFTGDVTQEATFARIAGLCRQTRSAKSGPLHTGERAGEGTSDSGIAPRPNSS